MNDPRRLRDGEEATELRALLLAAERDVLDDEGAKRVRASMIATVPVGEIGAAVGATLATVASKALVVALLAGAAAAGMYLCRSSAASAPVEKAPEASSRSSATTSSIPTTAAYSPPAPSPSSGAPVRPRPRVGTVDASGAPSSPAPPPALRTAAPTAQAPNEPSPREGLLLLQARQALDHDPARTLALIRQHEREFPKSQLAPERAKLLRDAESRTTD